MIQLISMLFLSNIIDLVLKKTQEFDLVKQFIATPSGKWL